MNTLNELNDERIVVVIPDIGFNYLDDPENKFKVVNVGITESFGMIYAANLALEGWKVFFYTMVNFALFRPYEMVRNAVVCHNAPVTIIGVSGSGNYNMLGFSHNLLHPEEDFKLCENIGLKHHQPQSNDEVRDVILNAYRENEARYIRL